METATANPSAATLAHWEKFPSLQSVTKPDIAQWLAELKADPELLRDLMAVVNIVKTEQFPPLTTVTRTHVDTAAAAYYLNRRPQTLRGWHCHGAYPEGLRPLALNGRLAWPTAGLRTLLRV